VDLIMDLGLKNKVALILASSKELGLACAKNLYCEGAHIIICSRSKEILDEFLSDIPESFDSGLDLSDLDELTPD
jgi:NAD(P)-dependent dehydrogenase (short-subunit alcohol dehydrogenase family)